ncbi:hypothetical protein T440DRAFT_464600 [Plenodomus tracheiphilus IPT5]|uniref:Uncharacterized protein n=1 Tax=Plenodomus tracheiphilus IPT5 TaxID=1408161 RepID=A0A6A7BIJ3_9PLEO|nr:hypothetical protein T440DRAFT_464600 [Plenodomus tracheiphilus IPT5]
MNQLVCHIAPSQQGRFRLMTGITLRVLLMIGQCLFIFSGSIMGPLMGITSVLWLIMRNDTAIDPKLSWIVFGGWSFLTLAYLMLQCHRVFNHSLYILLTVAVAGLCMCLVAIVQKSSFETGLVTAIPTCTSFAAYAVAFFFPDSHMRGDVWDGEV